MRAQIEIAFGNGLVPGYLESQLGALRSVLQSGVPTIRNEMSGHGAVRSRDKSRNTCLRTHSI